MDEEVSLSTMFEAVGSVESGLMLEADLAELEEKAMPYMWIMFRNVYSKFNELFMLKF